MTSRSKNSGQQQDFRYAHTDSSTTTCCCTRRTKTVTPFPEFHPNYDYIEIRPKRFLRIQHANLRQQQQPQPDQPAPTSSVQLSPSKRNATEEQSTVGICHPNAFDNNDGHVASEVITRSTVLDDKDEETNVGTTTGPVTGVSNGESHTNNAKANGLVLSERTRTASSVEIKLPNRMFEKSNRVSPTPGTVFNASGIPIPQTSKGTPLSGRLHNVEMLPAPDIVIFLVHGVGGSSDVWRAQIDYLSSVGYQLVVPDLIGHGFSCTPNDPSAYEFYEILQDLTAVFDKYCKRKNVIIGHSYGCSFSAVLARERPEQVAKLIMISGGSPTPLAPQPGLFQMPVCMLSCCKPVLLRGFKRSAFHDPDNITKTHKNIGRAFDIPTYVLKHTMNGQTWAEGDTVFHSYIASSTLIIHGKNDRLISEEDEQEMAETIDGAQIVVVDNASHMVMMERPEVVNKLLHDFIGQCTVKDLSLKRTKKPEVTRRRQSLAQSAMSLRSVKSIPNTDMLVSNNLK